MTMHEMNCAALDERLAEYLEDELDPASRRALDAHVATCVRCTALVRDLERIRSSAAELPELAPSTDLWNGIARRIDTPIVPLAPREPAVRSAGDERLPNVAARRRTIDRLKTAAIAAGLVALTAGVTYELTTHSGNRSTGSRLATRTPSAQTPDTTARKITPDAPQPPTIPVSPETVATPPTQRLVAETPDAAKTASSSVTSREIDRLRTIFLRNRSQLDPRTAAIIEANLKVIDEAIAQSKAALAKDPASRFLSDQLNSALDKKVELLRTAALLPSRT